MGSELHSGGSSMDNCGTHNHGTEKEEKTLALISSEFMEFYVCEGKVQALWG